MAATRAVSPISKIVSTTQEGGLLGGREKGLVPLALDSSGFYCNRIRTSAAAAEELYFSILRGILQVRINFYGRRSS